MHPSKRKTAVITGASSGIGEATARRLATEGFDLILGARRADRLKQVADATGGRALPLDVTDQASVEAFVSKLERVDVLVNNAGLAREMQPVGELAEDDVRLMWETNVMGLIRMTKELLPLLEASGDGHVVNISSTASIETYRGGGGYTASKHAVRALTKTLRLELLGKPIRVTDVAPGMVETEFSVVRFGGDEARAKKVYERMQPLLAEDIADCVAWAVTRPPHVNIDEIVVRPRAQATSWEVARED
jgi:NADP-dependent 3-hydroxy acid dehydrogenase YdfG